MKLITIVVITLIFVPGCSPKWMKYDWYASNAEMDYCLLEQSVTAHKDSLGKIVPDKIIDSMKNSEKICFQKINKKESATSCYKDDSLFLRIVDRKIGRKEIQIYRFNGLNDTLSHGAICFTKFGSIQRDFDLAGHLSLVDSTIYNLEKKCKYSKVYIYLRDTTIVKTITYFDNLFRQKRVEIIAKNGEIVNVFSFDYVCKKKCDIDTIIRTNSYNGMDFYDMIITKKINKICR